MFRLSAVTLTSQGQTSARGDHKSGLPRLPADVIKPSMKNLIFVLIALSTFTPHLLADVKLPAIFSDHMVLQAGVAVPVWGWADPGEEVSVSVAGQTKTTKADKTGK